MPSTDTNAASPGVNANAASAPTSSATSDSVGFSGTGEDATGRPTIAEPASSPYASSSGPPSSPSKSARATAQRIVGKIESTHGGVFNYLAEIEKGGAADGSVDSGQVRSLCTLAGAGHDHLSSVMLRDWGASS